MDIPISAPIIEEALAPITGHPISSWRHAADLAMIGFGPVQDVDTPRGPRKRSTYSLHIQCPWRVVLDGRVLVGWLDYHRPARGAYISDHDFDPLVAERTLRDELLDDFFEHVDGDHTVTAVTGSSSGDVTLRLDDGCILETFVSSGIHGQESHEDWRFFGAGSDQHFVVRGGGAYRSRPVTSGVAD